MEIKRKIEVFSAMNRRFVVRQQGAELRAACPSCGNGMLAADQLAKIFNVSQRNVFKQIEAGAVHFTELESGGAAMICIVSFADAAGIELSDESEIQNT